MCLAAHFELISNGVRRSSSGSLAILAAIRRASLRVKWRKAGVMADLIVFKCFRRLSVSDTDFATVVTTKIQHKLDHDFA
jgi:hypothetical protein